MNIAEKPIWKEGVEKVSYPKLEKNLNTEVAIVGAGLAGILSAYVLAKAGKKVVVLEKKHVGSGATEYTTAFMTQVVDTDLNDLVKMFGETVAKMIWQSGSDAIDLIEKIVLDEKIDCEFMRSSAFVYANDAKQFAQIREMSHTASKFGFDVSKPKHDSALNFANIGYFEIKNQAKFHPLKFLNALTKKAKSLGAEIYEESEVTDIDHGEQVVVETRNYQVACEQVIVATYQPFHNRIRMFLRRGMYRSYVIAGNLQKGLIAEGMYFDVHNPYHYFRIDEGHIILGGEDVKSMFKIDPEKNFNALKNYLDKIIGKNKVEITHKWMGPILEPSDGLPLIGQTHTNEYIASAFSGNGMTYSAVAAMIFNDLLLGRENVYARIYDPKRIPNIQQLFIKGGDYIGEFFGGVAKNVV